MDPLVLATFLVVGLLQIAVPILVGYWLSKRFSLPWKFFLWGALFFIVVQIIHAPLTLLIQNPVFSGLKTAFGDTGGLAVFALFLGLLAGLFEEIGRYLVFTRFFPSRKAPLDKKTAILFGAGWGGAESILIALLLLLTAVSYAVIAPLTPQQIADVNASTGGTLTQQQVDQIGQQTQALVNLTPWQILPSLFERLSTLAIQIAMTFMVFLAVFLRKKTWLLAAILFHTAVDSFAVFFAPSLGVWPTEFVIFLFAVVGLLFLRAYWKKIPDTPSAQVPLAK